jgi:stage III sporulation protein SpoIIIAA
MTKIAWHAYYFTSFDRSLPPARTAIIEAETEDEAGRIAIAQMGPYMRVDIARPVWGAPQARVGSMRVGSPRA